MMNLTHFGTAERIQNSEFRSQQKASGARHLCRFNVQRRITLKRA
jgi:hypothetical protein